MCLPPEKASELKQIIHNHLIKMDIHGKIREVLAETMRDDQGSAHRSLSEEDFLQALQRRGLIDDVMKDLHFTQEAAMSAGSAAPPKPASHFVEKDVTQLKKTTVDPSRRYLYLQVLGGKAFLEHLQEPEPLPGQVCSTFTLYVHLRDQRFHSKPVPCACEPDLKEGFLLEIHRDNTGDSSKMADATSMLSMCDPVHFVLIKTDTSSETTLVSSYFLDWRTVLSSPSGKTSFAIELMGVGSESKVPAGVLNVTLELYPPLPEALSPDIISTQQSLERQRTAEKERLFLVYAKQWWREFLEIRPSHQSKLVKIFAQDENGTNRPVCSYVRVLRVGRLLESPRQAARFVSLLAHEKAPVVGGGTGKQEQWCTLMAFLCRGKEKCAQYWPTTDELQMSFTDTGFVVRLLSEKDRSNYTIRVLELQNTKTEESRKIYHFHYTTWPDFGVPDSPGAFLDFLFKVRESGSLSTENGPAVVHCSAGIGRSGTFALVDSCLVLMDKRKGPSSVDIQKVLLGMREYRMGLIQTPDQLRFSYMAVIEGAKLILTDDSPAQQSMLEVLPGDDSEPDLPPPPPPPRPHLNDSRPNGPRLEPQSGAAEQLAAAPSAGQEHHEDGQSVHMRKRHREERIASTAQKVHQMKQRLTESEKKRENWEYWRPVLLNIGAGAALVVGLLYWMYSR